MAEVFEFVYTDEFDLRVESDESGELYVERTAAGRIAWMLLGLFVVAITVWFALRYEGTEGWLLTEATPAAIALFVVVGMVAEATVGTDRSAVFEEDGTYYLEMMPSSRWYVVAASVTVLSAGVSLFASVRAPGIAGSGGRRTGLAALAESVPFGEFVVIAVAVVISLALLKKASSGRMPIRPK